jgi:hypothetical protein
MRPAILRGGLAAAALLTALPLAAQDRGAPPPFAREGRPAWDVGVPAPVSEPRVFILNLRDGAEVTSPFTVEFGLLGMRISPAGEEMEGGGHHHLLIDADAADLPAGEPIPADENHRHFGGGQTETTLELPPGEHRLQLVMGDHNHVPHDPPVVSAPVTVTVR